MPFFPSFLCFNRYQMWSCGPCFQLLICLCVHAAGWTCKKQQLTIKSVEQKIWPQIHVVRVSVGLLEPWPIYSVKAIAWGNRPQEWACFYWITSWFHKLMLIAEQKVLTVILVLGIWTWSFWYNFAPNWLSEVKTHLNVLFFACQNIF